MQSNTNGGLIPIRKDEKFGQVVNARELHGFMEVKSRFNDWIVNRIKEYDFVENQDFTTLTKNLVSGGKQIDYLLTLSMAKELSMVERNEKGKEARKYFIACEEALHCGVLKVARTNKKGEIIPDKYEIRRVGAKQLADMLYDICQIGNHALRKKLANELYHQTLS